MLALLGTDTGLWEWSSSTGARYLGDAWIGQLGHEPRALDGDTHLPAALVHPQDLPVAHARLKAHLAGATPWYEADYRLRTKRGE